MSRLEKIRMEAERESEIQARVMQLYRAVGCDLAKFSSYRTGWVHVTPGWPDLMVFPPKGLPFAHETKTKSGKQGDHQRTLQSWFERCGLAYVIGGVDAAREHLERTGMLILP